MYQEKTLLKKKWKLRHHCSPKTTLEDPEEKYFPETVLVIFSKIFSWRLENES